MTKDTWKVGETRYFTFNTSSFDDGSPITLASGAISAYLGSNTTEITTGITLTADFDGKTGVHLVTVDLSTGYAPDTDVTFWLSAGTVGGTSVVGKIVKEARIVAADVDDIVSRGTLAAGGSTTAFTLPAGQRANVQAGDVLKPTGIPGRRIAAGYNSSTGAGTVTTAFASDPSSTYYIVIGQAPQDTASPTNADVRKVNGVTVLGDGAATPFHV